MNNKTIKIRHIQSDKVEIITAEKWQSIQDNGFAGDFQVMEEQPVPEEVADVLKSKKS